jgi:hypothetical protein
MRAISIKQPYASQIAAGTKRKEFRTWKVATGPIVIVSSSTPGDGYGGEPLGVTMCTADITKITEDDDGGFAWHLANVRRLVPVATRGYAAIYKVPDENIVYEGVAGKPPAKQKSPPARPAKPSAESSMRPKRQGRYTFEEHKSGKSIRGKSESEAADAYWTAHQIAHERGAAIAVLCDGCHTKTLEPDWPEATRDELLAMLTGVSRPTTSDVQEPEVSAKALAEAFARAMGLLRV